MPAVVWRMLDVNPANQGVEDPQRRRSEKRAFESGEELEALADRGNVRDRRVRDLVDGAGDPERQPLIADEPRECGRVRERDDAVTGVEEHIEPLLLGRGHGSAGDVPRQGPMRRALPLAVSVTGAPWQVTTGPRRPASSR
jgi:hypothetical protein